MMIAKIWVVITTILGEETGTEVSVTLCFDHRNLLVICL